MYNLVPPKSKVVDYVSPFLDGVVFKISILDFEEDDKLTRIKYDCAQKKDGEYVIDSDGCIIYDNEQYYIEAFRLMVKEIEGITGTFSPSWKVIKSVVNKGIMLNSASDLGK